MVHMYADDMTIYVHGKSIDDVQLAFNYESSMMDWFDQNKLVLNIQKSVSSLCYCVLIKDNNIYL